MQIELYSKFDENGVPTHDNKNLEFSSSIYNKLKKDFKAHQDKYEKNKNKDLKDKDKETKPDI
jgi:hypothetical protein